ncbi:DUF1660 family phage protein [Paenibacillus chitinolyticus]
MKKIMKFLCKILGHKWEWLGSDILFHKTTRRYKCVRCEKKIERVEGMRF